VKTSEEEYEMKRNMFYSIWKAVKWVIKCDTLNTVIQMSSASHFVPATAVGVYEEV
jgi:hypothetical protein